jgi:hypothetical protein
VGIAVLTLLTAISFYMWSAAAGVNRRDEVSAGAFALACMFGWWGLLVLLWHALLLGSTSSETARLVAIGLGTAPGGILPIAQSPALDGAARGIGISSILVANVMLGAWYARRFGQIEPKDYSTRSDARGGEFTASQLSPWRSPLQSIAWKQWRETAPLVVAGFGGIILTFALLTVVQGLHSFTADDLAAGFAGTSVAFGLMIAIMVAGIGVFRSDLRSPLNSFWRSRPIHPDIWFWLKYATSLGVILGAIYFPMAVALLTFSTQATEELLEAGWISLLLHVSVFTAAVAMSALFRHAVYAAILSLPAMCIGSLLLLVGVAIGRLAGWIPWAAGELWTISDYLFLVGLIIGIVINMLVAWLCVRFDWGVKNQ